MPEPRLVRFKIHPTGCWIWFGHIDQDGYGRAGSRLAHRWVYELVRGPVPESLLEPVTQRENVLRGEGTGARNARKTTCPAGHPYDEENTYDRGYGRICRACGREHSRRYRHRIAEQKRRSRAAN
jgi:hypothetical protein